jgi:hypothetical protein
VPSCFVTVVFRRVLVRVAFAVPRHHGGLLVRGRRAEVRTHGIEVAFRGRLVGTAGSLERLEGALPGPLDALGGGGQPTGEFGTALPQLVRPRTSHLAAGRGVRAAGIFAGGGHRFLHDASRYY